MSDRSNSTSGGIGFAGLLAVAFIVLKLTHFINWSWWWVLSPLWIPLAIALAVLLVGLGVWMLKAMVEHIAIKRRKAKRLKAQQARY